MTEPLRAALLRAAESLGVARGEVVLERPRRAGHGDLASNLPALVAARRGIAYRAAADAVSAALELPEGIVARVDLSDAGFLNFRLADAYLAAVAAGILTDGARYGRVDVGRGGELHLLPAPGAAPRAGSVAAAREAAVREAVVALLERTGWVPTERSGWAVALPRTGEVAVVDGDARSGARVPAAEVEDAIGADGLRWALLRPAPAAPARVDLRRLARATDENPHFRVLLAHARLAGLGRDADAAASPTALDADALAAALASAPARALVGELVHFPAIVARAADARDPSRVAAYLEGVAAAAHAWYHPSRAEPGPADGPIARAARIVLANALTLLGLEAPERI